MWYAFLHANRIDTLSYVSWNKKLFNEGIRKCFNETTMFTRKYKYVEWNKFLEKVLNISIFWAKFNFKT